MAEKIIGIIPARYGSSRFEGKPLADIHGKPMIQHVYERAKKSKSLEEVYIATDDERIRDASVAFGATVIMTSPHHNSGTERVVEAAKDLSADIIVNIQGDEPLIKPCIIDAAVKPLLKSPDTLISTVASRIKDKEDFYDKNVVKVVIDNQHNALYFSRSAIPHNDVNLQYALKHIGLYVYSMKFLLKYPDLLPSKLEEIEKLEQLRFLENGYNIKVCMVEYDAIGVDTPEDLTKVKEILKNEQ